MAQSGKQMCGAFASGDELQRLVREGAVYIDDDDESCRDDPLEDKIEDLDEEWDLDLCLGKETYLTSDDRIRSLSKNESISIEPGEFALLITEETVRIPPDRVALISLKFSHALKGLVNISGFHVDPNYNGKIIFSVYNAGPSRTVLRRGEGVFMIVFASLTHTIDENKEDSKYPEIRQIESDMVSGLQGRTSSLESIDQEVTNLQNTVRNLSIILTGLIVSIFGFILTQAIG